MPDWRPVRRPRRLAGALGAGLESGAPYGSVHSHAMPTEGPWSPPAATPPDWSEAEAFLSERDPVLAALTRRTGPCTLAPRPNSFGTLAGAIVAQQISAAAARTIHRRLWALTDGEAPTPRDILDRDEEALRRVGLSRQKIGYLRDLARRIETGGLDLEALPDLDDGAVRRALTAVRGIGDWTAHMHLIFTLNRPDVFAPGDAAVLAAMRDLYDLPDRAPPAAYAAISDQWIPWRSVGVWYLYEHIHQLRAANASKRSKRKPPGQSRC